MLSNYLFGIQGGIFALVDIGLLPIFIYTGVDIESRVSERFGFESNGMLGAAIGGGVGNLMTDMIGASFDPTMWPMIVGIGIFGTLSLGVVWIIHQSQRQGDEG
jgi:hypothetical protein|tara:strand:- start:1273 stop:1584 length:312 start_codon:yes stop_codon:yes gene_type:complete